jgi:hypothetical protein
MSAKNSRRSEETWCKKFSYHYENSNKLLHQLFLFVFLQNSNTPRSQFETQKGSVSVGYTFGLVCETGNKERDPKDRLIRDPNKTYLRPVFVTLLLCYYYHA